MCSFLTVREMLDHVQILKLFAGSVLLTFHFFSLRVIAAVDDGGFRLVATRASAYDFTGRSPGDLASQVPSGAVRYRT